MAYDFYTNVYQGMQTTPTSLYADAATAGTNVGNALPTKTTAAIRGAIQGIQEGQQIVSNQQTIQSNALRNEILQNQVDRLPETNRVQDLQLQSAELQQQASELKLKEAQLLQADKIKTDQATLQIKKQQLDQLSNLLNKKTTFEDAFSKADPLQQKQMVQDATNSDLFEAYPSMYSQKLRVVLPTMSQEEKDNAFYFLQKSNISKDQRARAEKAAVEFGDLEGKLSGGIYSSVLDQATANSNLSREGVIYKAQPVPSGTFATEPDGTIKIGEDGKFITNKDVDPKSTTYDLRYGNQIIATNVPKDAVAAIDKYKSLRRQMDGTELKRRLDEIGPPPSQQSKNNQIAPEQIKQAEQTAGYAPELPQEEDRGGYVSRIVKKPNPDTTAVLRATKVPVKTPSGQINLSTNNVPAYSIVQQAIGLDTKEFSEVAPDVKRIFQAVQAPGGTFWGYSKEQSNQMEESAKRIADYAAKHEYNTDPKIKEIFTQDMVDQHNQLVKDYNELFLIQKGDVPGIEQLEEKNRDVYTRISKENLPLSMLVPVETPEQLYSLRRSPFYVDLVNQLVTSFEQNIKQAKQSNAVRGTLSAISTQALNAGAK